MREMSNFENFQQQNVFILNRLSMPYSLNLTLQFTLIYTAPYFVDKSELETFLFGLIRQRLEQQNNHPIRVEKLGNFVPHNGNSQ